MCKPTKVDPGVMNPGCNEYTRVCFFCSDALKVRDTYDYNGIDVCYECDVTRRDLEIVAAFIEGSPNYIWGFATDDNGRPILQIASARQEVN